MPKSFFERLTGSHSAPAASEPPRERTTIAGAKPPAHLAVKTDMASRADELRDLPVEEEGELTVDIFDDGDHIVIQSIVGGVKLEDLDVQVTDDMVTIRGKRSRTQEIREENFYYRELYWGSFSRSVILPQEIVSDEAEAAMKNGLLTVRLPKRDRNKAQKVRVKTD